jgi:hypothetical protein
VKKGKTRLKGRSKSYTLKAPILEEPCYVTRLKRKPLTNFFHKFLESIKAKLEEMEGTIREKRHKLSNE